MKSLAFLLFLSPAAFAATNFILPGAYETGSWNLVRSNYNNGTTPAYPASGTISGVTQSNSLAWGGPIAATSTSATFTKLSGPGYFISSGSGLYGAQQPNTYAVEDLSPIANLTNLTLQLRSNTAGVVMGAAGGGFASVLLYLNGSSTSIPATFSETHLVTATALADDADYGFQWDLTGQTISSYRIVIETNAHNAIYGNAADLTRVTAGSGAFTQVVPEPSSLLFGCAALGLTAIRRRRA